MVLCLGCCCSSSGFYRVGLKGQGRAGIMILRMCQSGPGARLYKHTGHGSSRESCTGNVPSHCGDDGSHFRVQPSVAGQHRRGSAAPASVCMHISRWKMMVSAGDVALVWQSVPVLAIWD